jgi:hypothetical protein
MNHLILDNEAVVALLDATHAKHRTVAAHLEGVVGRRRRGVDARVIVPTTVRVEAGWNRTAPRAAAINRFRSNDVALDAFSANVAADLRSALAVSVADAHIGATINALPESDGVVVLTSDLGDIARVAGTRPVTLVRV